MPVILGGIFRLRLRAQHHFVDEILGRLAFDAREHGIELFRAQRAAARERNFERVQELAQRFHAFARGFVMHAIDQRRAGALQRFRRRDIGEDHEFLDQPVRVEPLRNDHAIQRAVGLEQDFSLGQIEIERTAFVARFLDREISVVERLEHRIEQGPGLVVGPSVDRVLRLLVVQLGGRFHQHAMECVRAFAPVGADHHAHGERRAIDFRA